MSELLEARLGAMQAINAYGVYYDEGRLEEFAELFTEDALVDITPPPAIMKVPLRGRREIADAYAARHREVTAGGGGRRHVCTNTVFESVSPDECVATTFLISFATLPGRAPTPIGSGVYRDRIRLEDGRWRFAERRLALDGLVQS